jgi:[ribosomal protein S5]-alanine N-acetyltransferase
VSYIETERLIVRTWMPEDLPALAAIYGEPATMRYIGTGAARTLEETRASLHQMIEADERDGCTTWPVVLKSSGQLVGTCGLMKMHGAGELEIGFAFAESARGNGYAYEAASAVLAFGFSQLQAHRILAFVHPFNAPSILLLNKLGLRFERLARMQRAGVGHDLLRYTLAAPV